MENFDRTKMLYEKYLGRTASPEEVEELFSLLRDRSRFEQLHTMLEEEWDREDEVFSMEDNMTWEEMQQYHHQHLQKPAAHAKRPRRKKIKWGSISWKVAAAAVLILLTGVAIWFWNNPGEQVYKTGFGETMEIVLDDDSHILLNANSQLTWHPGWQEARERLVELEGEAFFEVSHQDLQQDITSENDASSNQLMPFRVITPDLTVNVLGTSFNVASRRQKTDVFLRSGEVLLVMNDPQALSQDKIDNELRTRPQSSQDSIYLTPGDHVTYSELTQSMERKEEELTEDQASWIDGFLVYENERLETVLQDLEDIYGKSFVMEDSTMLDRRVDLGMPYEDWNTVSGLMTLSLEIDIIQNGDRITIKKQGK